MMGQSSRSGGRCVALVSTPSNNRHPTHRHPTHRHRGTAIRARAGGAVRACCPTVNQSCKNWSSRNGDSTMRPTSTRSTRRRLVVASVVALALAAAACGSDDDSSSDATGGHERSRSGRLGWRGTCRDDRGCSCRYDGRNDRRLGRVRRRRRRRVRGEARRAGGRGRRGRGGARVRPAGAGVRRVVAGRQEDLLDAGGEFAHRVRQHGPVGRGHRPVGRDGGVVLLPERRWAAGLAGRHGTGDQRRLRRRRPRLRHRSERADPADGGCPRAGHPGGRHAPRRRVGAGRSADRRADQR